MNWYYRKNETTVGPVEMETLLTQINGETFVWKENSEITDWVKAKEHKDLIAAFKSTTPPSPPPPPMVTSKGEDQKQNTDTLSTGLKILSFIIPLVGAIIYFSNKKEFPVKAKSAGRAALWGLGIAILLRILLSL